MSRALAALFGFAWGAIGGSLGLLFGMSRGQAALMVAWAALNALIVIWAARGSADE
jgi:hypothetical protein